MKKLLITLLLFLLGIQGEITLTHEHKDHKLHPDCHICILQISPQKKEEPKIEPKKTALLVVFIEEPKSYKKPFLPTLRPRNSRAPPA